MTDLNYYSTLIAVADDCPVASSVAPAAQGGKQTVATIQYELLAAHPYGLTQEDVLFESWMARQDLPAAADRAALRHEFFARPQACLRASPLPKRYGWGLHFDGDGRVALCAMDSPEYQRLVGGHAGGVTVLKALRSRRA